jgi:HlyD family secretion protein
MKLSRRTVGIAIAVLIVLAIVHGFMPKPVPVDTVEAKRAPMTVTVVEEGKTRGKGAVIAELEPLRSEVLDPRRKAEAGARVKAAQASLSAAEESVRAAQAEADYAEAEFNRMTKLHADGYVTEERFDRAEADYRHTQAQLQSAEFTVDVAKFALEAARTALRYSAAEDGGKNLKTVTLRTPVDGNVLKVLRESEGVVNAGETLISIGDPQAIEVEVDVLSDDAVRIKPGMRVIFERWGGEEPLEGKVRVVEPAGFTKISALGVEEQRVLVIADITSPPEEWERLGDGFRVEASFILWEEENVLQVPESSLFRYEDGWAVFAMENEKARLRKVKLGHRSGLVAEIVSGIKAGETVITHPDESIEDGTSVRKREK